MNSGFSYQFNAIGIYYSLKADQMLPVAGPDFSA
jgi:hypothetical protein